MNFANLKILVAGDVMLDHYISGEASRISPEAPVPVVHKRNAWSVPGGAANVACGVAHLGCKPSLVGLVGEDAQGTSLIAMTEANGIHAMLVKSPARPTICKTRILAGGQQLLRLDEEAIRRPDANEFSGMRDAIFPSLTEYDVIVLSDYAKGVLLKPDQAPSLPTLIIPTAREANIPVLVDPKGSDWSRYRDATCVTPNTKEFMAICHVLGLGEPGGREPSRSRRQIWAEAICEHFNFGHLLLTRGRKGMTLYTPGQEPVWIKAEMAEVADVSGAGDTVVATLAAAIGAGLDWPEAAKIANTAAGVAVTKVGATPVGLNELERALGAPGHETYLWSELEEKLRQWRDDGQRIVFTNGCFDILHPGHIAMLRQSAALGDRLIVGLNSDASVRRLKGPERPIQNEQSRATLLNALEFVDAVIIFEEDTPEHLVRAIKPDILAKGSDYRVEDIAGAEFVQSHGGRVELVPLVAGFSTTDIARRIQGYRN